MELDAGRLEGQGAEVEQAAHLAFEIVHHVFVLNAQHEAGQHVVPVVHQLHVLPVVVADFAQAVGELLAFAEQLLEAAEAARQRMSAGVDHLGVGQDELDQADVEEVVRHLVDEERGVAAVGAGVVDELLAETPEVAVFQLPQDARIAWLAGAFVATAQAFGEVQHVVQLHGAVHLRMGCENLLQQGGAGPWQPDDEDRVRGFAAKPGATLEEFPGAHLHLAVHAHLQLLGAVLGARLLQRVALAEALERGLVVAGGFVGVAEREADLQPVFFAGSGFGLDGLHPFDFVAGEDVGLGVRQAPVGVAVVRLSAVRLLVQRHGGVDVAVGLVHVGEGHRIQVVAGMGAHQLAVVFDGLGALADAVAGRGVQRADDAGVVGVFAQQSAGLLVGAGELLHAQQDVGVLDAGVLVPRLEGDAAVEQKLGLVEDAVAHGDLGQQAHAFDVGLVAAQEVLAQAFGVLELSLGQVAAHRQQLRRQRTQGFDLILRHRQLARGLGRIGRGVFLVELGEALPAVDQRRVGGGGFLEGSRGACELAHGDVVVADFLPSPPETGLQFQDALERLQRKRPLVLMAVRHRQGVVRLDILRRVAQQRQQQAFRVSRCPLRQQLLGFSDLCGNRVCGTRRRRRAIVLHRVRHSTMAGCGIGQRRARTLRRCLRPC